MLIKFTRCSMIKGLMLGFILSLALAVPIALAEQEYPPVANFRDMTGDGTNVAGTDASGEDPGFSFDFSLKMVKPGQFAGTNDAKVNLQYTEYYEQNDLNHFKGMTGGGFNLAGTSPAMNDPAFKYGFNLKMIEPGQIESSVDAIVNLEYTQDPGEGESIIAKVINGEADVILLDKYPDPPTGTRIMFIVPAQVKIGQSEWETMPITVIMRDEDVDDSWGDRFRLELGEYDYLPGGWVIDGGSNQAHYEKALEVRVTNGVADVTMLERYPDPHTGGLRVKFTVDAEVNSGDNGWEVMPVTVMARDDNDPLGYGDRFRLELEPFSGAAWQIDTGNIEAHFANN